MARLQFCRRCTAWFTSILRDPPTYCHECTVVMQTEMASVSDEPRKKYELTGTDAAFLKSIRVASEA